MVGDLSSRPSLTDVLKAGILRPPKRPATLAGPTAPTPLKQRLQAFQIELLTADYTDFTSQPRYKALLHFFFSALYAPQDFSLRNASFRTLHDWLVSLIGHDPVRVLAQAIELNDLTESLDDDMVIALRTLGVSDALTVDEWERAYRLVDRRSDRIRQVEMLVQIGKVLDQVAAVPFVDVQLRAVRPAVALVGWEHVIDFLVEGYRAIRTARPIDQALNAIHERELARIDRLLPADQPRATARLFSPTPAADDSTNALRSNDGADAARSAGSAYATISDRDKDIPTP